MTTRIIIYLVGDSFIWHCYWEGATPKVYMRVEQKVHERGFLCVSLWVCNEQSRLKFFSEMAKEFFFLAKVLVKVHVDMSKFAL